MKKFLSLIIALSLLISVIPCVVLAEDTNYTDYGTPVVIDADTSQFIEMEDFSVSNTKLLIKENDADSSGGKYLYLNSMPTEFKNSTMRLSIETSDIHKIKIFARIKRTSSSSGQARVSVSKNAETMIERPFFYKEGHKYMWVCLDSFELEKGENFTFNMYIDNAATGIDKLFITGNIHEFPKNMSETTNEIDISYLTDYYNEPQAPIKDHPRLFVNNDTISKVRNNLTVLENQTAYNSLITNSTTVPQKNEFSSNIRYMVSNAFLSVIEEDEVKKKEHADIAIRRLVDALSEKSTLSSDRKTRSDHAARAYRIHVISLIYDWCYDYLTEEIFNEMKEKYSYLDGYKDIKEYLFTEILFYVAQYEMTYPPALTHGSNNGHISEAEVFLGLLSTSLAFYDEYPDMYRLIGGKLFDESIWARNFYYEMRNHTQGSNYMSVRMANEFQLFALLESGLGVKVMSDGADELLMEYIYGRRPDGLMFRNGDGNGPTSYTGNLTSMFFFANYLKNPYLRDEFSRQYPVPTLGYTTNGLSDYLWLIYNDPEVVRKSYKELPLTRFTGKDSGVMYARTSWEMGEGDTTNTMAVRLNLETMFGGGHDHLDSGHFDIYYKGALALDTGFYPGTDEQHHRNYFKRTVAHNSMLLYDPDEYMANRYSGSINDGGQKYLETVVSPTNKKEFEAKQKTGKILAVDYGEDMYAPSFSYMKGDLTGAYATNGDKEVHKSEKMKNYTRSFVFLNFFDDVYPGALIVFDKMTSNNPEFKKTWLLHTQEEPKINGGTTVASKTENGDNGRLINTTLLPKAEDREIVKIGGKGKEFVVNGTNYPTEDKFENKSSEHKNDYGVWRIELSPKEKKATDYFLNVLHVTENDETIPLLTPELIEAGDFAGVKIKDRIALFGLTGDEYEGDITFNVSGKEEFEILVTDIKSGAWDIYKDGVLYKEVYATTDGKNIVFKGTEGTYTLKKDTLDLTTFTKNLNYLSYVKPLSEQPEYIRINEVYVDLDHIIRNDLLYVDAQKLSKVAGADYVCEDGNIKFTHTGQSVTIPVSSDKVIYEDGKYFVDLFALRELYVVEYTHPLDDIYTVMFEKRSVVEITTGSQFASTTFNAKKLYVINGNETLNDGSKGIVLPESYDSKNMKLQGVIRGVDKHNNIQLTSNKPLFNTTGVTKLIIGGTNFNAYSGIYNINLKGTKKDGSGYIVISNDNIPSDGVKANGVLLNYSTGAFDLEFININNYVNLTASTEKTQTISHIGTLIGRRYSGKTIIRNYNNYGNVDATNTSGTESFRTVGGFIGQQYVGGPDYITKLIIESSKNYGNISAKSYATGGMIGNFVGEKAEINILKSGNYGNVSSTATDGTGGIIGATAATTNIIKTFNGGNVKGTNSVAGLIGSTSVNVASTSIGSGSKSTFTVENSFNAGDVTGNRYVSGIMYGTSGTHVVKYCYNAGTVTANSYLYEISNKKVDGIRWNYHLNSKVASDEYSEYVKKESLATELPTFLHDSIWEYTMGTESNLYSYPQIIGNTFVYNKDQNFYFEKYEVDLKTGGYNFTSDKLSDDDPDVYDTYTGEKITSAYAIVPAKFKVSLGVANDSSFGYGMLISKTYSGENLTKDTAMAKAPGIKNVNGTYGILFYGNMIPGGTYYVRPYVEFKGEYTYGETTSFVFPVMKTYGINDWILENKLNSFDSSITKFKYVK